MTPRVKKFVSLLVLLPGLLLYVGGAVTLAEFIPDHWLAQLAYFIAAGLLWAPPVIPLMAWAEREPPPKNEKGR